MSRLSKGNIHTPPRWRWASTEKKTVKKRLFSRAKVQWNAESCLFSTQRKTQGCYRIFVVWAFSAVDGRKQFEYAGRSLNLLLVLFACRRRCTPSLKVSFLKRPLCLLSKSQKMNQRQFSFWKFYWEACSQNRPFIARYFHLPYSTHTHLSNKNPAYGPLKMHHCIAGSGRVIHEIRNLVKI